MYYSIDLSVPAILGGPAPLPAALIGLAQSSLDNLSAALDPCPEECQGVGYWPEVRIIPEYDPATQRLSDQVDETPDPATRRVIVTPLVVNLTSTEITERRIAEIDAALAASDGEFQSRWIEDLAAAGLRHPRMIMWTERREALRAERATLSAAL